MSEVQPRRSLWSAGDALQTKIGMALMRIAPLAAPLFQYIPYTIRHGLARGLKRRGGLGFLVFSAPPLTREERFLTSLDLTGHTVYDVGGYQGLYTLYFARAVGPAGRVICFEPIPANQRAIEANVALNGFQHVELRPVALGATVGQATLLVPNGFTGAASGDAATKSAYVASRSTRSVITAVSTVDEQARSLPPPTLLKIDVEGMEEDVLAGAAHTLSTVRPALFIEVHATSQSARHQRIARLLSLLHGYGYQCQQAETQRTLHAPSDVEHGLGTHLYAPHH
jgi:FkbM family methyltransferase